MEVSNLAQLIPKKLEKPQNALVQLFKPRGSNSELNSLKTAMEQYEIARLEKNNSVALSQTPEEEVTNKCFYYSLMIILAFFHVGNGYSMVGTALILNTIANKNNFDFSDAEKSTYLGLIVSLYLLGYGVSTLTVGYFLKFSQRTILIVFVIAYFLLNICLILPYIWLLLLGRFGLGCTYGVMGVIICSNLSDLAPPSRKSFGPNMYNICFVLGTLFTFLFTLNETGGEYWWRLNMFVNGALVLLTLIVLLICFPQFESPTYLYRMGQETKVKYFLSKYLTESAVKTMMGHMEEVREMEKNQGTLKVQQDKPSAWKRMCGIYIHSTMYGVWLGALVNLSGILVWRAYSGVLCIENPDDIEEKEQFSLVCTIGSFFE